MHDEASVAKYSKHDSEAIEYTKFAIHWLFLF